MALKNIICAHCGKSSGKQSGAVNRALNKGLKLYCDKTCAGKGRQLNKTTEQKKLDKKIYDEQFRAKNRDRLKKEKAEWFKRTYDPIKASVERKKIMPKHVEYCRQPKYKEYKKKYDEGYCAKKRYGEFAEAAIVLRKVKAEIDYKQVIQEKGLTTKTQKRKRLWHKNRNSQQTT